MTTLASGDARTAERTRWWTWWFVVHAVLLILVAGVRFTGALPSESTPSAVLVLRTLLGVLDRLLGLPWDVLLSGTGLPAALWHHSLAATLLALLPVVLNLAGHAAVLVLRGRRPGRAPTAQAPESQPAPAVGKHESNAHGLRWPVEASPLPRPAPPQWARRALWVPVALWVVGTPAGVLTTVVLSLTFFGATPSEQQVRASMIALVLASACGVGAPVAGLVLARRADSRRASWWYSAALVVGGSLCAASLVLLARRG